MPIWEWKLVTTAEYRKLKNKANKKSTKKEAENILVWKECYWFDDKHNMWEWEILEEKWSNILVSALNRSLSENPNREIINIEVSKDKIKFDKRK